MALAPITWAMMLSSIALLWGVGGWAMYRTLTDEDRKLELINRQGTIDTYSPRALQDLRNWIEELLEYRRDIDAEDIVADDGESIETVDESSDGTVVIKKVSCGKENCKCQRGELHGPYKYVVRRKGDTLEWDYRGPVSG